LRVDFLRAFALSTCLPGARRFFLEPSRAWALVAPMLLLALWAPAAAQTPLRPIFVLNSLDASISVIDPRTYVELRRVPTGKEPHHLYLTPDEKSLIVANALADSLTLIDPVTAEIQRTIVGIADPYHLRFSPNMRWFVTASNRLNRIDIYRWVAAEPDQPLKLAARVAAPRTPSHLMIDSKSTTVYASLQDSDELIAIDLATQTPRWKIAVGKMPADLFLSGDDRTLLVALTGEEVVEAYDVGGAAPRLVKRIRTGAGAHAFRARGDGRHVLVSNRVANTISLLDLASLEVVESYPAPGGPDCMDMLADGKTLLTTSRWARKLTVIDTEKKAVVRQVAVGRSPHGVWTLDHAPRR
jgi:YVTN family beta-propeller protein